MAAVIIIAIIAAVLAILLLLPVRLEISVFYNTDGVSQYFEARYGPFRLFPRKPKKRRRPKTPPEKPEKEQAPEKGLGITRIAAFAKQESENIKELIYAVLGYLFKHLIRIESLDTRLILGLEDAMNTGLAFGSAAAFLYTVLGVIDRNMRLEKHKELYRPDFENPNIQAGVECIISTNLFHAVAILLIAARHGIPILLRFRKQVSRKENEDDRKSD